MKPLVKEWVDRLTSCCEDEQQTDLRLVAAEILVSVTPIFLTSQKLLLGKLFFSELSAVSTYKPKISIPLLI